MKTVSLGNDRLGSGKKQNISLHGYERSTHDLSCLWKSTMSAGTLVPFLVQLALPGDTWDIDLDSIVKTHPTIGPLFGSFKLQLDVFTIPIRLYNRSLHNNKLGVGMNMSQISLPRIRLTGLNIDDTSEVPSEFQQINQSCLLAYLGIRGLGSQETTGSGIAAYKNAIPFIAYWDIFKNYYANKQEELAYVIHGSYPSIFTTQVNAANLPQVLTSSQYGRIEVTGDNITWDNVELQFSTSGWVSLRNIGTSQSEWHESDLPSGATGRYLLLRLNLNGGLQGQTISASRISPTTSLSDIKPVLSSFTLSNIDAIREEMISFPDITPYTFTDAKVAPFGLINSLLPDKFSEMYALCGQEGLAVKTYQSDLFNNWIQTDWIDGAGGIAELTAIDTTGDSFTIDTLNLSKKVYDMLNRIAVSGGSYEDWLEAVYDHNSKWRAENPIYQGGLSREIVFQEVISNAATTDEPLGTLAGKGVMTDKKKGGKIIINIDEPSFIMGIVSITPRIDYSQGNEWWTGTLNTMDDLHKPALDGIGFQDLVTDQMAFWDTEFTAGVPTYKSAGKQPAWINYMTNYNRTYGNFADPRTQMFMTLNRRYVNGGTGIGDLTTYIDPEKFNYAFAQTDLSAMNFWVQIACDITARRKISAKIIPNL